MMNDGNISMQKPIPTFGGNFGSLFGGLGNFIPPEVPFFWHFSNFWAFSCLIVFPMAKNILGGAR